MAAQITAQSEKVDVSDARKSFADLVSRVGFGHQRVVLCRNGKETAALVSVEDLRRLQQLEDEQDLKDARAVLKRGKFLTSAQARKKLGIP